MDIYNSKILYLASYKAKLKYDNVIYQDLYEKRDLGGDMMEVDLTSYDIIIATPPCNYWSRANYRREISEYAQMTKHLLPDIIHKLILLDKPFLVENVKNAKIFKRNGLYDVSCYIYEYGRHTYWTNIPFNPFGVNQKKDNIQNISSSLRQGGNNVNDMIEYWLSTIHYYESKGYNL